MSKFLSILPSLISLSLYLLIGIENLPPVWPIALVIKFLSISLLLFGAPGFSNCIAFCGTTMSVISGILNGKFLSVGISLFFFTLHLLMSGLSRKS